MNWQQHISSHPAICHGKPCVRGTRVLVSVVLSNIAAGESWDDISAGYHIPREAISAAVHYAAAIARDDLVPLPEAA